MIQNAQKNDAVAVISLLNLAMEKIAFSLSGESDRARSDEILCEFFKQKNNRLSYENILVFRVDNAVVGAICGYSGLLGRKIDEPFRTRLKNLGKTPNIATECDENAFYISDLAVNENFRGQKIATKLIEAMCQRARDLGFSRVSLLVDILKPKTQKFYENLGFLGEKMVEILGEKYHYMVKELV